MLVTLEHYPAGGIPRPRMQLYRLASSTRCCEQKHGVSRVTPRPMFASFHVRSEQIAPVSSLSLSFPLPLLLPFPSPPLILPFLSSPSLFAHILLCPNPLPSPKQKTAKPTPAWTHQEPKQTGHCSNSPPPYMHSTGCISTRSCAHCGGTTIPASLHIPSQHKLPHRTANMYIHYANTNKLQCETRH